MINNPDYDPNNPFSPIYIRSNEDKDKFDATINVENRLKNHQTFINTGRGQQVDEIALLNKCKDNPLICAVLDVLEVEPPITQDSLFFKLPNVFVTPHIAGSSGNEVVRMAEYMYEESKRFVNKEATKYEVTMKMLETMA